MSFIPAEISNCSTCQCAMDVSMLPPFTNVQCPECGEHNRVKSDVGSYVLMKRQGVGGMSLVFGAVDKTLGREVAIKILNEEYSMDEKRIEQFEQEARITASLSHPHIVKVFTVGQAYNRFFIAMELVSGDSLEQKMADNGALPEADILHWAKQVADGLNAANEAGLIHRDIKPGNILFDKEGHVKIVDFGLALVTQGGKAQADEIWATPYYVPPEALDVQEEDFRSDIYALGASLFHALTGKPPFSTESRSTSELKEIKRKLPSISEVAPWLSIETCAIIDRAMSFEMDDRFSSYQELIDALQYASSVIGQDGANTPMNSAERAKRRIKSGNGMDWKMPAMVGAGVLVIGGVLFAVLKDKEEPVTQDPKPANIGSVDSSGGGTMSKRVGQEITLARGSLKNRNYKEAARRYGSLARDRNVSKDTIYWAGLQSATVYWLNGQSGEARKELRLLSKFNREEGGSGSEIGSRLQKAVDSLTTYGKINPKTFPPIKNEVDANIAFASGLKNWSAGHFAEALQLFQKVEGYSAEEPSLEFNFYRARIADYKHDASLTSSLRNGYFPKTMDELNQRVGKLQGLKGKLRTKGRSLYDLEEWNVQTEIHKKRLIREAEEAVAKNANANNNGNNGNPKPPVKKSSWAGLEKQIQQDIADCRFDKVEQLLKFKDFADEKDNERVDQMIYLCRNASGFKASVKRSLRNRNVSATLTLKNGGEFSRVYNASSEGFQIMDKGRKRWIQWGEIEPSDLVDLHRFNVAGDLSDFEKNLRLEQAICFAFLAGEDQKAQNGARSLAKTNPLFKNRWTECMKLLDK